MVPWIVFCFISANAFGSSGGSGTADDPYQIATAQDLIDLGNEPKDYDRHFVLTADIDLAEYVFDRAVICSGYRQKSIVASRNPL